MEGEQTMSQLKTPKKPIADWEKVRDEWVRAVEQLVSDVESWCKANDWPTRRIQKRLEDSRIGEYYAPALLIQVDLVKLMLEPVARFTPGSDGVVDLYQMPEYDDIANVYRRNGAWQIHYTATGDNVAPELRSGNVPIYAEGKIEPFTAEEFTKAVKQMI
jgi:hypothetical protein